MAITEGTVTVNGQELYTKTWSPDGPVRAKMVMVHGFNDHIGRYYGFFPALAARGIAVYGFDQRGWGRSVKTAAERGLTGPTATVVADVAAFIEGALAAEPREAPLFVLGHSMGGNEVATLMAAPAGSALETGVVQRVRGWLLEAPFFGFPAGEAPSAFKVAAGRLAGRLLPRFQLRHHIPETYLSRDPAVVADLRADALCHGMGTLEGLAALLDRVGELASGRSRPGPAVRRLWLGHGDADRTTSFAASEAWFQTAAAGVPDKTFRRYAGWFHQLHAEPPAERELFYREVGDWILARAGGGEEEATATPTSTAAAPEPVAAAAAEAAAEATAEAAATEAKL